MATDDPTAVNLPRMNVPGMQTPPPPQPPGLDPMEGLKNVARDAANSARAQFAPQPRPPVAPLMGPDAGASFLPALQKIDAGMRGVHPAITAGIVDAIEKPNSNYTITGQTATDPDVNGMKRPPGVDLGGAAGRLMDRVGEGVFGADYQRPRTQTPAMDPFAYRAPAAAASPPGATPAPAAPNITPPPAAAPVAGAPASAAPGGDKFDKQVQLASLISAQNNSRTPVSNPYEGPAAGVAPPAGGVHGSIGVEGFKQQLANIQALQTPAPQMGGGGGGGGGMTWQEQQNAEMTRRGQREDIVRAAQNNPTRANTALARQLLASMDQEYSVDSGERIAGNRDNTQLTAEGMRNQTQFGIEGMRGRNQLAAEGMRGANQLAAEGMRGRNQLDTEGMRGSNQLAVEGMRGDVSMATNAATNASAQERTRMMVDEGRYRTDQTALAEQNKRMAELYGFKPELIDPRFGTNAAGQRIQFGLVQPKDKKAEK